MKTLIIAEAGVNHNGSLDLALKLVDAAAEAGADVVKFQTFKSELVISKFAPKADYQTRNTGTSESQLEMVRKLELDTAAHRKLIERCRERGIAFLSTPFDLESIDLLVNELQLDRLKLPSGEITNAPYLLKCARTGKPLIVSTGMSDLMDVERALGVLAFGFTAKKDAPPSPAAFAAAFKSDAGRQALRDKVTILHCTTEYPTPFSDVNLRAMETLRTTFQLPVGFSDHTPGINAPLAAVALGAVVVEKHFTLDRRMEGPDHKASLEPGELKAMCEGLRQVGAMLGSGNKVAAPSEIKNKDIARKSLVAARPIRAGETFSEANLTVKRPGNGISPMAYWDYLGTAATRDYSEDELIEKGGPR